MPSSARVSTDLKGHLPLGRSSCSLTLLEPTNSTSPEDGPDTGANANSDASRSDRELSAGRIALANLFAHELGNIANNINLQGQLLQRKFRGQPASVGEPSQSVLHDARRLNELVAKFRGGAKFVKEARTTFCLGDTARYAARRIAPIAMNSGVDVRCGVQPGSFAVQGHQASIDHLVAELCSNAVLAMPSGGLLSLSVAAAPREVRLAVADTGPGRPNDIDIFAPFTTTRRGRMGLGLATAQYVAAAHQGFISSEDASRGAVFTLTLPKAHES